MKKNYLKPDMEIIDFKILESIMQVDVSIGVGDDDGEEY